MQISSRPIRWIPFTVFGALCVIFLAGCPHTWIPQPPYPSTTGTNDFDLTSKSSDANGSPEDPRWAPQPQNTPPTENSTCKKTNAQPYQAECTDQAKYLVQDTGEGLNGLLCTLFGDSTSINGHVDWTVASTRGGIGWLNFASDGDYNLLLAPEGGFGLTEKNNELPNKGGKYIEIEFDSSEFAGRFGTHWWKEFGRLADKGQQEGNYKEIQDYLHADSVLAHGLVYGIFGIDCEHGCRSEIHPAFAVAIQVKESKDSNQWAIFARNWGDEGYCSHLDHQLNLSSVQNAIHLVLPYKSAAGPKIKDDYDVGLSGRDASQCPAFRFLKDEGEEITIPLPAPGEQALTEVFVDFQWPDGASPGDYKQVDKKMVMDMVEERQRDADKPKRNESVEARLGKLRRQLDQGKKSSEKEFRERTFKEFLNKQSPKQQNLAKRFEKANEVSACPVPEAAGAAPRPAVSAAKVKLPPRFPHPTKKFWDQARIKDLCTAYALPGNRLKVSPEDQAKLDKIRNNKQAKP